MKRILRIVLWIIGTVLTLVLVLLAFGIQSVDRTEPESMAHYNRMMNQLDSLSDIDISTPASAMRTGFAKENLTPAFPVATAGYGKRRGKRYPAVHDSIFVRAIVFENGTEKVAVVSADLLIIPPPVTELLSGKLPEINFSLDNTYLNATHTHNSIGNWGEGAAGLIYGSYSDSIVTFIADKIIACIRQADSNLRSSQLRSGSIAVPSAVKNRLDKQGSVDSLLHLVEIVRDDSTKLVMASFNAHATCLFAKDLELSRDYPGVLVDDLEQRGYDFAMFLAGAVGSHGMGAPEAGWTCLGWMADEIMQKADELRPNLLPVEDSTIMMVRAPLYLDDPEVKITRDLSLRPWLFRAALPEYQPYLTGLRVGTILLLGTPCDYSGSLSSPVREAATENGFHVIITSFNGHYIGYITEDKYYDLSHYETRLMNWYGPGNGRYITECLLRLQKALY